MLQTQLLVNIFGEFNTFSHRLYTNIWMVSLEKPLKNIWFKVFISLVKLTVERFKRFSQRLETACVINTYRVQLCFSIEREPSCRYLNCYTTNSSLRLRMRFNKNKRLYTYQKHLFHILLHRDTTTCCFCLNNADDWSIYGVY